MKNVKFKISGLIAKHYGIDGVMNVEANQEFSPSNMQENKWCDIWVKDGIAEFTVLKEVKEKEPELVEEVQEEVNDDFQNELNSDFFVEEEPKRRGRPSKK